MVRIQRSELDREYRRLILTAWMLMAAAVPMTAVAVLVDMRTVLTLRGVGADARGRRQSTPRLAGRRRG